ncbi:MAG TPA: hypothetical protein VFM46_05325 [Pseudomonadales bacterium]|nr:hypothetical protein [Pseudomonadales bacterium]
MTNEEMLAQMRGHSGFHSFGIIKVQRMFHISYGKAHEWIEWLIANGHAERMECRPWEVVLK